MNFFCDYLKINPTLFLVLQKPQEFDVCRAEGNPHSLMIEHGIDAIPFVHPNLEEWRMNFKGVQYFHEATQLIITGAVDDLWINPRAELIVVDYKATSTSKKITLDEEYRQSYKRQMEIYQWLLRRNGFKVSNTGYFVYCNGDTEKKGFYEKLEFKISLLPYEGNDSWVEGTLLEIRQCLEGDICPSAKESCDFCNYRMAVSRHLKEE